MPQNLYNVTDLMPNAVAGISTAAAINKHGAVVGQAANTEAFVWEPTAPNATIGFDTILPMLPPPPAGSTATCDARAINSNGDIVGVCGTVDGTGAGVMRGYLYAGGQMIDLGTLLPNPFAPGTFIGGSTANGINDAGQIVGGASTLSGVARAVLWDPNAPIPMLDLGSMIPFTSLPGTPDPSEAFGINNGGDIVGVASAFDDSGAVVTQAFIRFANSLFLQNLGTGFPGTQNPQLFDGNSSASAINDAGLPVGTTDSVPGGVGSPVLAALFYDPIQAIGPKGVAAALNNAADPTVVGYTDLGQGQGTYGWKYTQAGGVVDLNSVLATPDWHIDQATGVNDKGQICGIGTHTTLGGPRAVLLMH